ncbi:MAG: DUF1573 domain-containing protein [Planctomycetota bacterium]|jgi:hypothetical protein
MNRPTPRLLTTLATLALSAGTHAAILAPDDLNLGLRGPGEVVEATVWLINTDDEPLEVLGAKGNCGCTTLVGFVPQTLPARSALEVALRITAPKKAGQDKAVAVTFTVKDRPPIRLPIRIETTGSRPGQGAVTAAPLDLGRVTAARRTESTIRLTNTATEPARVTGAKAGCGCITFPDFAPFELDPGASADVRLSIKAPSVTGRPRTRDVTFVVADHAPVKVPVRLQAVHPLADALGQYLGQPETSAETGRWYGDFRVEADTVSAIVWAGDDTPRAQLVCRFDEGGQVRSIRVEPITMSSAAIQSARRR